MNNWLDISQLQKKVDHFYLGPIDLSIEPGTITALVGNNGSGKSTLLKLIMNLANPDMGNIKVFDKFVYGQDESWKKKIAYQAQTQIGHDAYTGKELKSLIAPLYPDWDEALFKEIVNAFSIPLTKRYRKLSQGVQQKLNLALTIPRNAPLLLLDEPTSFMDIPSKKRLMDILVEWMDQGEHAIIFASHQAEDIMKLADYLCILRNGKVIGTYEKEELTESYKRYWLQHSLPESWIPGEISREKQQLISNQPDKTEQFFNENNMTWSGRTALHLEEIITYLLQDGKEG
ncbi:ATP-binding cassette domain-containing protein [Lentibacillus sp. Marseille-P4043]|uniref:ATP-binding cassette domain-containing protein n=1 Tax=Lentibacillus sp. Marseille-P4043 TaxID=2040293 RepID=UPI000D0AE893|nr:ABC transporter ATP-binding protein [Lentibacillus sp. Marseille-P4043]